VVTIRADFETTVVAFGSTTSRCRRTLVLAEYPAVTENGDAGAFATRAFVN